MKLPRGIFVTGTDTGVGKTLVSIALVRALVTHGLRIAVMKPIASGADETTDGLRNTDALLLAQAANVPAPYDVINPYCFRPPISPHLAAHEAGVAVNTQLIKARFEKLADRADFVVVEGAGGWLAPIGANETMANVAAALGLPVMLVVGLRLGCLNHAFLTARAIEAHGSRMSAWVGNHIESHFEYSADNIATLEARLGQAPLDIFEFRPQSSQMLSLAARVRALELLRSI